MAFTVEDFQDLLRMLDQRPEWRAELRRQVLTDELLELPDIVRQLAQRLDQLAAQVALLVQQLSKIDSRVGTLEGEMLEMRYERRYPAYFGPVARKLRLVDRSRLADMLDEAVDAGQIEHAERQAVMNADLVLSGQRREDRADAYFVVDISVGIGLDDVNRAAERAHILAKLGGSAIPVVAGNWIDHVAEAAASDLGVVRVLDGRLASAQ